jgi:hypothetical protein
MMMMPADDDAADAAEKGEDSTYTLEILYPSKCSIVILMTATVTVTTTAAARTCTVSIVSGVL